MMVVTAPTNEGLQWVGSILVNASRSRNRSIFRRTAVGAVTKLLFLAIHKHALQIGTVASFVRGMFKDYLRAMSVAELVRCGRFIPW